jgi:hypothetical protein
MSSSEIAVPRRIDYLCLGDRGHQLLQSLASFVLEPLLGATTGGAVGLVALTAKLAYLWPLCCCKWTRRETQRSSSVFSSESLSACVIMDRSHLCFSSNRRSAMPQERASNRLIPPPR